MRGRCRGFGRLHGARNGLEAMCCLSGGECLDSTEVRESEEARRSGPVRGAQSLDDAAAAGGRCRCRRTVACGRWVHWQRDVLEDGVEV
jgi:hypothetical protein